MEGSHVTAIELPAKYDGWVEAPTEGTEVPQTEYLLVQIDYFGPAEGGKRSGPNIDIRRFVPPKPKPTIPEVKPGAVVSFTSTSGRRYRILKIADSPHWWVDQEDQDWTPDTLLEVVTDDGFTVELEGL
jgi:hypothetical protein